EQGHPMEGMVICICPDCSKIEHEDEHGALVPGAWVHPGTHRKHLARLTADPEDSLIITLHENFEQRAHINMSNQLVALSNPDTDHCSDSEDASGGLVENFADLVCKFF
ncbi:hypothetical protein CROQUDRAFT_694511, partial [Cronartium quercuum f. sp. fusiforme G11]